MYGHLLDQSQPRSEFPCLTTQKSCISRCVQVSLQWIEVSWVDKGGIMCLYSTMKLSPLTTPATKVQLQ